MPLLEAVEGVVQFVDHLLPHLLQLARELLGCGAGVDLDHDHVVLEGRAAVLGCRGVRHAPGPLVEREAGHQAAVEGARLAHGGEVQDPDRRWPEELLGQELLREDHAGEDVAPGRHARDLGPDPLSDLQRELEVVLVKPDAVPLEREDHLSVLLRWLGAHHELGRDLREEKRPQPWIQGLDTIFFRRGIHRPSLQHSHWH